MSKIKKLGIIAGGGQIPKQVIEFCQSQNIPFFVIALQDNAEQELTNEVPHIWARLGEAGKILKTLKNEQVTEITLIGAVKRPSLSQVVPDWEGVKILAKIAMKAFGDDSLLRSIIAEIEKRGFKVIGVHDVLPEIIANEGVYGKIKPNKQNTQDIKYGIKVASELGVLDIGQGAVIQEGIILAVEAIEGTNEMLKRAGSLKRVPKNAVFIKVKKANQDNRVDLPTIGVETVMVAAENGLDGIAVQAGGVIVIDKEQVIKTANQKGLFVVGVNINEA